jgi:alpha-beta hydrolase superfamily lysophospholipase
MIRKGFRWARSHRKLTAALFLLALFFLANGMAYLHARAMTHFVDGGTRPKGPESLSLLGKVKALLGGVEIPRPLNHSVPSDLGLSYSVHLFPGEAGVLEAWHVPHDKAKGIVLMFHGYAACKAGLLREARAFHELGYACFLIDFRGSGSSGGDTTTIGYREADDVDRAAAYVREHWPEQRLILFGQSMGGAAVLRALAVNKARADAVVLECPFDRLLSAVEARFQAMGMPAFPGARLLVFWGGVQHGFNGFAHDPADYAQDVTCPVLLLHGENDLRVTVSQTEAIFERLGGEKQFHSFAGLGHESYVAKRPDEWKEWVGWFLDEFGRRTMSQSAVYLALSTGGHSRKRGKDHAARPWGNHR